MNTEKVAARLLPRGANLRTPAQRRDNEAPGSSAFKVQKQERSRDSVYFTVSTRTENS